MKTEYAVWYVVQGGAGYTDAVHPELYDIVAPDEVWAWSDGHGHTVDNPDVDLLVAPADEDVEVPYLIASMEHPMSPADMARLRDAVACERREYDELRREGGVVFG